MKQTIIHTTKKQVLDLMACFAVPSTENGELIWTVPAWLERMWELSKDQP